MYNICTLFDKNYLLQGIALYESLSLHTKEKINFYILALDDETVKALKAYPKFKVTSIGEMLQSDENIIKYKESYPYHEFCWALSACFMKFIFDKYKPKDLFYIDSDIYFFNSIDIIKNEIGDKSIGIHSHRYPNISKNVGQFNVGVVYFKNNLPGISCLVRWKNLILSKGGEYFKEYATCGDQKFLELFPRFFPEDICIFDTKTGHGAPWNARHQTYLPGFEVIWDNRQQPLVFYHYSHFSYDSNGWKAQKDKEYGNVLVNEHVSKIYQSYYNKLKSLMDAKK